MFSFYFIKRFTGFKLLLDQFKSIFFFIKIFVLRLQLSHRFCYVSVMLLTVIKRFQFNVKFNFSFIYRNKTLQNDKKMFRYDNGFKFSSNGYVR